MSDSVLAEDSAPPLPEPGGGERAGERQRGWHHGRDFNYF